MVISYFFTTFAREILFTNIKKIKYEIKSFSFEFVRSIASQLLRQLEEHRLWYSNRNSRWCCYRSGYRSLGR